MQSILTDEEWAIRDLGDGEAWTKGYWRTRYHPHRTFLVDRINKRALRGLSAAWTGTGL